MVMKRGTRMDMLPGADVPLVTATAPMAVDPALQREFPELAGQQFNPQTPRQEEATKAEGGISRERIDGQDVFKIGSNVVTQQEYETAREIRMKGGYVSPELQQRLGELGEQPFAGQMEEQQRMAELAGRIGADPRQSMQQQGQVTGQAPPIDLTQAALAAGLGGVTAGAGIASLKAIFGGTIGAAAASGAAKGAILGPKGALIGMAVAVGGAVLASGLANIRSQRSGDIRGIDGNLGRNERIMNDMIAAMNMDPANAEKYLMAYETAKAKVMEDYGKLNSMTNEKLTLALSQDGTRTKYKYAHFTEANGMMAALDGKATRALVAPDMEAGMSLIASLNFGGEE